MTWKARPRQHTTPTPSPKLPLPLPCLAEHTAFLFREGAQRPPQKPGTGMT